MRKVTYGAACSLDGYIARADGGVDWLHWSDDVQRLTAEYWAGVDTVLMGRKTYDVARALGSGVYPSVTNYFTAGLIDEVGVNIQPVLLGAGVPLFQPLHREIRLELTRSEILDGGCVYALYNVRQ